MCLVHGTGEIDGELSQLQGLDWYENGQSALSGQLLALYRGLDALFADWSDQAHATAHHFPSFMPLRELQRLDYLQSFPHLATFPVTLDAERDNLSEFSQINIDNDAVIELTHTEPVKDILTPAACYHFYIHYQGQRLSSPLHLTTCCTCYRHEQYYRPLQRQWSFNMRELVCIGTEREVEQFLVAQQQRVSMLVERLGIEASWQAATDPFFRPEENPKYLAQKILPIKQELVLENGLAIASVNRHHDHFGRAFDIHRGDKTARSGCVAFGMERWLYALLQRFGTDATHEAIAALDRQGVAA